MAGKLSGPESDRERLGNAEGEYLQKWRAEDAYRSQAHDIKVLSRFLTRYVCQDAQRNARSPEIDEGTALYEHWEIEVNLHDFLDLLEYVKDALKN